MIVKQKSYPVIVAGLLSLILSGACTTTAPKAEEPLQSSEEFLESLDKEPDLGESEFILETGSDEELVPKKSGDDLTDYSVDPNYETFDPQGIRVPFAFDSAKLSAKAHEALDQIVEGLQKDPIARIYVRGHADRQGPEAYNDRLSERRAKAIYRYLKDAGISSDRLITVHLGESDPVELGSSRDAHRKNRRGDFVLDYADSGFRR